MPHVLGRRLLSSAFAALAAALTLSASACSTTDVALGAGATAGVAASEERGIRGSVSDTEIATRINYAWLNRNVDMFHSLNLFIYEGRVLVTGVLPSTDQVDEAVAIAWKEPGVREVINEIIIDPSGRTGTFASDSYITAQLKAKLLFDRDVSAVNYSVDSVRGIVYVMGIAQSQDELDRVIGYARNIRYVKKVVNHAILKTDPRRKS
ncbi:MAG: BON domain-containing protein [Gemmatimonas sp.]